MQPQHQSRFQNWHDLSHRSPATFPELVDLVLKQRKHSPIEKLAYEGPGLDEICKTLIEAIAQGKRIALYADYDVDGTMSCVSWIWFFRAIGHENFLHYIPCRFREGYGVNLGAIQHLIHNESADLIITMDTGITANEEAAYCKSQGVSFICTDHHKIQPDKMPDCLILNPKLHEDEEYQELCGCGITFVLLRKLGASFKVEPSVWRDLLSLAGIATICDVVPLNSVNHKIAKLGIEALCSSTRPVLRKLLQACQTEAEGVDERDVGFRLGPRINAVGRLEHADAIIRAFVDENADELIRYMGVCNDKRKLLQESIQHQAVEMARERDSEPILFLGHPDWHPGVVGIVASKLAEQFWKPVWLYQILPDGLCKGSTRAIPGFDVTAAMVEAGAFFTKFGGHRAAGGFSFKQENAEAIRDALTRYAKGESRANPKLWQSLIEFDCHLRPNLIQLALSDHLDSLKPFGHGFPEPRFLIKGQVQETKILFDKTNGSPKHTIIRLRDDLGKMHKVVFFQQVYDSFEKDAPLELIVTAAKNTFRGKTELALYGCDLRRSLSLKREAAGCEQHGWDDLGRVRTAAEQV